MPLARIQSYCPTHTQRGLSNVVFFLSAGGKWNACTTISLILVILKLSALCSQNYPTCSKSTHFMFCQLPNSFISVLLTLYNFTSSVIHVLSFCPCVWEETPPILNCSVVMSRFWWFSLVTLSCRFQKAVIAPSSLTLSISLCYMPDTDTTDSEVYSYISEGEVACYRKKSRVWRTKIWVRIQVFDLLDIFPWTDNIATPQCFLMRKLQSLGWLGGSVN